MRKGSLLIGLLIALGTPAAAAGKKAKVPARSAPVSAEPAPVPPPPEELKPAPPPSPAAEPVVVAAPPPPVIVAQEAPAPAKASSAGLLLEAAGGVVVPFNVLGVGGRGEIRGSWLLANVPLGFSVSFGFEQHSAKASAFLAPPAGGFDAAGLDNQTLYPAQVMAHLLLLLRDEHHRLQLGAGYAALITWTQTQALGKAREESGLGHELAGEFAYARRFGVVELDVRLRYSVRRTAVGPFTTAMELPWYQTAGVLIGLGLWP